MTGLRRGLLPLDPAKHARFKSFADYGYTLPAPSYPIDRSQRAVIPKDGWGMDGNGPDPTLTVNGGQPVGNCGPCAVPAHANMLTAALCKLPLAANTMTSDQVVSLYLRYTGGRDTGVDLGDWLLWLFQQGLIEGFVKLPGLYDLDAALSHFNVVVVGVNLNPQADAQCEAGQPWDVGPGDEPDPSEGHAILYVYRQSPTGLAEYITWGQRQFATAAWQTACPQQGFAVITRQEAEAKGFPFDQLVADLTALGGTAGAPSPSTPPATKGCNVFGRAYAAVLGLLGLLS
jgi:hypothetical protein